MIDDAIEEIVFADQAEVAGEEQRRFERGIEQIERYVEDQLLVLRRRLTSAVDSLRAAEEKRDAALGADARSQAEQRTHKIQAEIDTIETELRRLGNRDDADYERWREHVHQQRYRPPEVTRLFSVEFILE